MTAQIQDRVEFSGVDFALVGIDGTGLFDPADHGVEFVMTSTANYRGFQACYAVRDERLVLTDLYDVGLLAAYEGAPLDELPRINGVAPTSGDDGTGIRGLAYVGVDLDVRFSGGLLLADGFIHDLYVHMGFHPAWKFERVVELILDQGHVLRTHDRSAEVADLRAAITAGDRPNPDAGEDAMSWIARSFERDYARNLGR